MRVLLSILALFALPALADEDLSMWHKRMPIIFSGYPADGETLTNFPVLVVFSDTTAGAGFDFSDCLSPPYGDLRFTASDKITPLEFEVESWDTNSLAHVWVRVPELTNNEVIYAFWGQSGVFAPACTTNGAVWESGFRGVWHLAEDSPGTGVGFVYRDSTAYTNHGSDYVSATGKSGVVNGGQAFDGTDDYIAPASLINFVSNNYTISFWVYPTTTHEIDIESSGGASGTSGQRYALWPEWGDAKGGSGVSVGNNGVSVYEHGASYMPAILVWSGALSGWTHVTVVYQAKQPRLYINGVLVRIGYTSGRVATFPATRLGGDSYGYFPGKLDEFRVESVSRASNRVWACYMNMASNSVFNTYGEPEYQGGPIVTNVSAVSETNYLTLNGFLVSTGMDANVSSAVYWGRVDAGRQAAGWDYTNSLPGIVSEGPISINVSPDQAGVQYYFRFFVSNSYGVGWASPAEMGIWWADIHSGTVFSTW